MILSIPDVCLLHYFHSHWGARPSWWFETLLDIITLYAIAAPNLNTAGHKIRVKMLSCRQP